MTSSPLTLPAKRGVPAKERRSAFLPTAKKKSGKGKLFSALSSHPRPLPEAIGVSLSQGGPVCGEEKDLPIPPRYERDIFQALF